MTTPRGAPQPELALGRRQVLALATVSCSGLSRLAQASTAPAGDSPWGRLAPVLRQGGCALVLRHAATEPGIGDPPQFTLGQCHTQRNLSAQGRAQSRTLGDRMRSLHLQPSRVLSSPWCRCIDTATLAFGSAQTWAPLGSFFTRREDSPAYAQQMRAGLLSIEQGRFEVWVTHMVNIEALTGEFVASGEGLVVRAERSASASAAVAVSVLGRWPL